MTPLLEARGAVLRLREQLDGAGIAASLAASIAAAYEHALGAPSHGAWSFFYGMVRLGLLDAAERRAVAAPRAARSLLALFDDDLGALILTGAERERIAAALVEGRGREASLSP